MGAARTTGIVSASLIAPMTLVGIVARPAPDAGPALSCSAGDINNGKGWIASTVDRTGPGGASGRVGFRERGEVLVVEDLRSNGRPAVAVVRVCVEGTWHPPRYLDSGPREGQDNTATYRLAYAEGQKIRLSACERHSSPEGLPSYRNCGSTVDANT